MQNNYNIELNSILKKAEQEKDELRHPYVGSEHLFLVLLKEYNSISNICEKYNLTYDRFKKELIRLIGMAKKNLKMNLYTPLLRRILNNTIEELAECDDNFYVPERLLLAILEEGEGIAIRLLMSFDIEIDSLYNDIKSIISSENITSFSFGKNLNDIVDMEEKVVGREREIRQIIEMLLRKKKNNPLLVGDAGVGKTAIVEELARRINNQEVPLELQDKIIINVEMGSLVAGTKYRGEFEEKLNKIVKIVSQDKRCILFIDEIHTMTNAGGSDGAISAGNILKPYLARDDIRCIGATTTKEFEQFILPDKALMRRFAIINVNEPTREETLKILSSIQKEYENHHLVSISKLNLKHIVDLSCKYIPQLKNPDKAIDLLDSVCSYVKVRKITDSGVIKLKSEIKKTAKEKQRVLENKDYEKAFILKSKELKLKNDLYELTNKKHNKITSRDIYEVLEQKYNIVINLNNPKIIKRLLKEVQQKMPSFITVNNQFITIVKHHPKDQVLALILSSNDSLKLIAYSSIVASVFHKELIVIDIKDFQNKVDMLTGSKYNNDNYAFKPIIDKPNSLLFVQNIDYASSDIQEVFQKILKAGKINNYLQYPIDFHQCCIFFERPSNLLIPIGFDNNILKENDFLCNLTELQFQDFDVQIASKTIDKIAS